MGQLYWLISMPILLPTVVKLSGWGKWPRPWLFMASWKWKWKVVHESKKMMPGSIPFQWTSFSLSHHRYHHLGVQGTTPQSLAQYGLLRIKKLQSLFLKLLFVHFFVTSFTFYPESLSRLLDLSAALVVGHVEHRPPVHLDKETKQNKFRNSLNIFTEIK